MSAITRPTLSREEYLRRERLAETRSEYHRGKVVAMAGTSREHSRIVSNIVTALNNQLRLRPCNVYPTDLRVSILGGERYLYPDVVATCGREVFEDDVRDILVNPLVIIEILSPSTEAYDRGENFLHFQSIESLMEYVLITQSPRRFEIYRKQPDGAWLYQSWAFSPPPLVIQSIDCTLEPDEVYFRVEGEAT